jgi:leader peptidase (prepilin peptidase)/N-methyltransferase
VLVKSQVTGSGLIAIRIPALVAICAAATSIIVVPGPGGVIGAVLAVLLTAIATIDGRQFIIPNYLTAAVVLLGLIQALCASEEPLESLMMALFRGAAVVLLFWILSLVYEWFRGRAGIGFGDVKLAGAAGILLSWNTMLICIQIATTAALLVHLTTAHLKGRTIVSTTALPFGLYLAPAIWLAWLIENAL